MAAHYDSKHGIVAVPPEQLYMSFTDMRNLTQSLPEKYRDSVTADFDSIHATVQGFSIAVRVVERNPYSLLRLEDDDAPFHFSITAHFDPAPGGTDFSIEVDADLNLMMKALLGGRIKDALDKAVDGLVQVSQGKRPEFPSDLG
ncbi:MAG: SRPBCC family protein [Bacteroidales bacterium]|nr:SRPBCC family protein [Bacteroidales bacterium]